MLIYKKKIKNPFIINNKNIDENIERITKENNNLDKIESTDENAYYPHENDKDAVKKNINKINGIKIL